MNAVVGVVLLTLGQVNVRGNLPDRVRQVIESHKSQTSEIEWTVTHLTETDHGLVERYVTRASGPTAWQANFGDENGYHPISYSTLNLTPIPREESAGPRHSLVFEGDVWRLQHERDRLASAGMMIPVGRTNSFAPLDFTSAGMSPWRLGDFSGNPFGLKEPLWEGVASTTLTTSFLGNTDTITAQSGKYTLEWDFDNLRGGSPIRAAIYLGDELLYHSETELREVDGKWFPWSIRFYNGNDVEPRQIIEVQKASFDQTWHRTDISPNDIGVLFGTQLCCKNDGVNIWTGDQLISWDEYQELLYIYGMRPPRRIIEADAFGAGRTVEQQLAHMDEVSKSWRARYRKDHNDEPWIVQKSDTPDEWDIYVAEFIKKHKLDKDRIERANEILAQSKKLRDYQLRKNRGEMQKAKKAGDAAKIAAFEKIKTRIFERVLVRGLERLVPQAERERK